MNLKDRKWKAFFIAGDEGVFEIRSSCSGIDKNKLRDGEKRDIPYITRSDLQNGVKLFVRKEQDHKYGIDPANVITIGLDTQTVFYQPYPFFTGQNIQVLTNERINRYSALFVSRLLKVQLKKFNWGGNGATLGRLSRTKIQLPVNSEGEVDYEFMEQYIKDVEQQKIREYTEYCKATLQRLGPLRPLKTFSQISWRAYEIRAIAEVDSGIDIYDNERIDGELPYITAGVQNNGIGYFVGNANRTIATNAISVSRNGAGVGSSFFHKYAALYSGDCRKVELKEFRDNEFVSLFITNQIMLQRRNYNYSRKMGTQRLRKQKILLPAFSAAVPDYAYMESYIKNIMINKYQEYLNFLEEQYGD